MAIQGRPTYTPKRHAHEGARIWARLWAIMATTGTIMEAGAVRKQGWISLLLSPAISCGWCKVLCRYWYEFICNSFPLHLCKGRNIIVLYWVKFWPNISIYLSSYNGKYSWEYGAGVSIPPSAPEGKSETTKHKWEQCKYTSPFVWRGSSRGNSCSAAYGPRILNCHPLGNTASWVA